MTRWAAQGTLLKIGDGAPTEVFTTVAQVMNITGPGLSLGLIEADDHDTVGWKEKIAEKLADAGEVSFEIHYDPAAVTQGGVSGLLAALKNKTKKNWQLVFPVTPSAQWDLSAFVTRFEPGAPTDGKLTASVTLGATGAPTLP